MSAESNNSNISKDTKETRGEKLRKLRKSKGLTLEKVHRKTKIHIGIIKALEDDEVSNMSPAYVKGLLKIYCNFLGVNYRDFIDDLTQEEQGQAPRFNKSPLSTVSMINKRIHLKSAVLIIGLLFLSIIAFKFGRNISTYKSSYSKKRIVVDTDSNVSKRDNIRKKSIASVTEVSAINKPKLGIRAKEDCWLEVKIDGKTIFRNILKKGHFEYWEAQTKIEFSLGNAGGVEVEVNGRLLSPLGRRGQVIKNITVTKDGLAVPE